MTVKITKPELNLREKISELDYSKVPYEKMPAGSVVQTQFTILTGSGTANEAETTSSTYQQTNHTVTISPKFKNSIILNYKEPFSTFSNRVSNLYHSFISCVFCNNT